MSRAIKCSESLAVMILYVKLDSILSDLVSAMNDALLARMCACVGMLCSTMCTLCVCVCVFDGIVYHVRIDLYGKIMNEKLNQIV